MWFVEIWWQPVWASVYCSLGGDSAHAARSDGTDSDCVGSGNPPHITSLFVPLIFTPSSPALYHLVLYVCVCTGLLCVCVSMIVIYKEKWKNTLNLEVCFPVLSVSADMAPHTPRWHVVGFVVQLDKYYWPVQNIFVVLPDTIFPTTMMIHLNNPHTQLTIIFMRLWFAEE